MSAPDALVAAADAARSRRELGEARGLYEEALAAAPDHVGALQGCAIVRQLEGDLEGAFADFRRSVELAPQDLRALLNLARMHNARGEHALAEAVAREATQHHPQAPKAWFVLGGAQRGTGSLVAARESLARAHALAPDDPKALVNLAAVEQGLGIFDAALEHLDAALELAPDYAPALLNQASVLLDAGELEEAEEALLEAREVVGAHPMLDQLEGRRRSLLGDDESAESYFRRAIARMPQAMVSAHDDFGQMLARAGRLQEAMEQLEVACAIDPGAPEPLNNLGCVLKDAGRVPEALAILEGAVESARPSATLHSNLLLVLQYDDRTTREQLAAAHAGWAARWAPPPLAPTPFDADPERRLRLGYLSADFRTHSVATFLEPLLRSHDRSSFEVHAFASVPRPDGTTERLRGHVDRWHDIHALSDEAAARRVREAGIDILVDLGGHTADHRLGVLGRRPAPLQATYLGYPDGTGMPAVDLRLTDALADPPDDPGYLPEALVRLEPCGWCYEGPDDVAPARAVASRQAPITFGSFNQLAKVSDATVALWAALLQEVGEARLLLKAQALQDPAVAEGLRARFAARGIDPERLELVAWTASFRDHLRLYHRLDVALDTFPYHGTTTTCEALWMGVPVVSLAGDRHASRVGCSLLSQAGLQEGISTTAADYVARAAAWAHDEARRAGWLQSLRAGVRAAPLGDAAAVTRGLERALREQWRRRCARP